MWQKFQKYNFSNLFYRNCSQVNAIEPPQSCEVNTGSGNGLVLSVITQDKVDPDLCDIKFILELCYIRLQLYRFHQYMWNFLISWISSGYWRWTALKVTLTVIFYGHFQLNKANLRVLIAVTGLVILPKLDPNPNFGRCDTDIWQMTSKNNKEPLPCP